MNNKYDRLEDILKRIRTNAALVTLLLHALLLISIARADVILHAFNWKYSDVAEKAPEISSLGYKAVLISPPLKSSGDKWWARYQPQDYRIIDNPLGNKTDFVAMIEALSKRGLRVYVDIIFNHMANELAERPGLDYPGGTILHQYQGNPEIEKQKLFGNLADNLFSSQDFEHYGRLCDFHDVWSTQHQWLCSGSDDPGLPKLNGNAWVVAQQREYLRCLRVLGVKGFRVDAAKHMRIEHINAVFTDELISGMFVFGDIMTFGGSDTLETARFLNPYLYHTKHRAYDFPLHSLLLEAFGYGGWLSWLVDPLSTGHALHHERAVTFTVTHDIPGNSALRKLLMDETDEWLAYAYLVGRGEGTPLVYSDHNESDDGERWVDVYKKHEMRGMIRFHNATQGESMQLIWADQCLLIFKRGKTGIVGINKSNMDLVQNVDTDRFELNWHMNYVDLISGDVQRVQDRFHSFDLPARSARMWLLE